MVFSCLERENNMFCYCKLAKYLKQILILTPHLHCFVKRGWWFLFLVFLFTFGRWVSPSQGFICLTNHFLVGISAGRISQWEWRQKTVQYSVYHLWMTVFLSGVSEGFLFGGVDVLKYVLQILIPTLFGTSDTSAHCFVKPAWWFLFHDVLEKTISKNKVRVRPRSLERQILTLIDVTASGIMTLTFATTGLNRISFLKWFLNHSQVFLIWLI